MFSWKTQCEINLEQNWETQILCATFTLSNKNDKSHLSMYTSNTIVINMVNFLNTVNMGKLEETKCCHECPNSRKGEKKSGRK